jgi:general secretion pathway protein I
MRRGAAGFTLLEIAVAIAILGISVVVLQQIYQGALQLQGRASRHSRAVLHARAAMDALLFPKGIKNHTEERTTQEGFKTKITVRAATPAEGGATAEQLDQGDEEQTLRFLEVDVTWQDGARFKTYTLRSLRLAAEPDE